MMRQPWVFPLLALVLAFGVGVLVGALIFGRHAASATLVETDTGTLLAAARAAVPAATTGSGYVTFSLDAADIHVHADSMFANQSYDTRVPALVRGSPITLEISARLLRSMLTGETAAVDAPGEGRRPNEMRALISHKDFKGL